MHRFTEITSAIPLPSIQKGEQSLNKKALRGLFFIYYISPKVGSPESRTQQLVRSRFWLAPFYVISKGLFSLVAFFACFRALIEYIYQKVVYLLTC